MALSYDEPDALAAFAEEYGVSFPLLSDPDSEIIERFGILNTLIDPDDHPWHGIPFPGSYVVGADGIITAKFFEANLALRANADELRRAATGEEIVIAEAEPPDEVTVDVMFDGSSLGRGVVRDLVVTLRVPAGQHLYGRPVPAGMVATDVEFDEHRGLVVRDAVLPPTRPHTLAGTGEVLQVFDGDVVIRVPITQNGKGLDRHDDTNPTIEVAGTVRWQSCDDDVCHLPMTRRFALDLPATDANEPEFRKVEGSTRMDFGAHFGAMVARREDPTSRH